MCPIMNWRPRLPGVGWRAPFRAPLIGLGLLVLVLGGLIAWDIDHLRAAQRSLAEDDPEAAEGQLRWCVGIWATPLDRHYLAARIARQRGRLDDARTELEAC